MKIYKLIFFILFFIFLMGCNRKDKKSNQVKELAPKVDTFYYDPNDTLAGKVYQQKNK